MMIVNWLRHPIAAVVAVSALGVSAEPVAAADMLLAQAVQPPKEAVVGGAKLAPAKQPSKEEALLAVESGPSTAAPAPGVSACSLCYSCGGNWPTFSGVIPTRQGASPWERGPQCSGSLSARSDNGPYLCCR